MGVWFRRPRLGDGEQTEWEVTADNDQGHRQVGGRLFVTNQRLLFVANRFDRLTGGTDQSVSLSQITTIGQTATTFADGGPVTSSLRPRLTIEADDVALKVTVRNPADAQKVIEQAVADTH